MRRPGSNAAIALRNSAIRFDDKAVDALAAERGIAEERFWESEIADGRQIISHFLSRGRLMKNFTKDEAVAKLKEIFNTVTVSADGSWTVSGRKVALAASTTSGSCCYLVDGHKVCVDGVTAAECTLQLDGNPSPLSCSERKRTGGDCL
jgi:hypothetical protein